MLPQYGVYASPDGKYLSTPLNTRDWQPNTNCTIWVWLNCPDMVQNLKDSISKMEPLKHKIVNGAIEEELEIEFLTEQYKFFEIWSEIWSHGPPGSEITVKSIEKLQSQFKNDGSDLLNWLVRNSIERICLFKNKKG